jgi:hypothetical protein
MIFKHYRTKSAPNPHQNDELTHNYLKKVSKCVSAVIAGGVVLGFSIWIVLLWYQTSPLVTTVVLLPRSESANAQGLKYAVLAKVDTSKSSVQYLTITEPTIVASIASYIQDQGSKNIDKKAQTNVSLGLGTVVEHILFVPDFPSSSPTFAQIESGFWYGVKTLALAGQWRAVHQWLQFWGAASSIDDEAVTFKTITTSNEWQKQLSQFASGEISRECAVAVINTTDQSGVAKRVTTVLEQTGIYVIRVTDSFTEAAETKIMYNPDFQCERELEVLQSLVPNTGIPEPNAEVVRKYRADAVVMVGTDISSMLK